MADTTIKLSGTYDSIEAYRILEEMRDMSEDYEDIKTEAEAAASAATAAVATANAAVTNATTAANNASTYAGNANTSASDAAGYAANASTSATNAAASETNASNSAMAAAGSASAAADSADDAEAAAEFVKKDLPLPIGFEYFSMNPNIPQGSLPLIGGVYNRETYADLWAWVQTQSGYLKTEAEWQTLSTANNGNVPFYSSGDGSTTFRVPSLHCWIKGSDGSAQLVGSYLAAGLPNITGDFRNDTNGTAWMVWEANGVFMQYGNQPGNALLASATGATQGNRKENLSFDASRGNPIYGNANTVQPESIVGMWLVKAYGVIVDTGTIDEQAYIDDRYNAMKTYVDNTFSTKTYVDGKFESVVSKGSDYIRYDSGLQICFGVLGNVNIPYTLTYPVPFVNTPSITLDRGTMMAQAWSNTGCVITTTDGSSVSGQFVSWSAIGWWK